MVRNGEAQFYTDNCFPNARIAEGSLIITDRKERWEKAGYTSANVTTEGRFAFTDGKVQIRARIPAGRGTWPASWTLGADRGDHGWPGCGEIDLMEYVGMEPELLHFTVHTFTVHTQAFNHTQGTQLEHASPAPNLGGNSTAMA